MRNIEPAFNRSAVRSLGLLIIAVLCVSSALGAELPVQKAQEYLELDEILVQGRRPANDMQKMASWLSRLVGEFRYAGHVERRGAGEIFDRAEVRGVSQCLNIGAPGLVQCLMNVSWPEASEPGLRDVPGGASYLTPAVALYGIQSEPVRPGETPDPKYINHMQVDSRGLAETGMGQLFDDTLIYKTRCADLAGDCQRLVQIEAPPDGKAVRMSVVVEQDSKPVARYFFEWIRVPQPLAATSGTSRPVIAGRLSDAIMPEATQNWLRKLVGKFRNEMKPINECRAGRYAICEPDKSARTECLGIGSGPGVRCLRNMGWQESRVPASRSGYPMYELWGYDIVAQRIVHAYASPLYMDNVGGATFASGKLTLNTLYTPPSCEPPLCTTQQITISSDGRSIRLALLLDGRTFFSHHRLIRLEQSAAEVTPDAPRARNPSPRRP